MLVIRHNVDRRRKKAKFEAVHLGRLLPWMLSALLAPGLIGCAGLGAQPQSQAQSPAPKAANIAPKLEITPSTVSFSATVGVAASQTLKISNSGGGSLTVSQVIARGAGLSVSGFSGPKILAAGASTSFNLELNPTAAGPVDGQVSIATSSPVSGTSLSVSGQIVNAKLSLSVGSTAVNFGTLAGSKSATQIVELQNTGNAEVTVSQIFVRGAGFSVAGASVPLKLAPSQSASVDVVFAPGAVGSYSGTLMVSSNASDSSISVALSGKDQSSSTSNPPPNPPPPPPPPPGAAHWVGLTWDPSTSSVFGYNVYRGSTSKGPFTRLNGSLVTEPSYTDAAVIAGDTYFYVTTAVNGAGEESAYSNSAEAVVP
jgi:HYDIN/CFA65/VesB family protein